MPLWKKLLRLGLILAVLIAIPILVVGNIAASSERSHVRARYELTRQWLHDSDSELEGISVNLSRLSTSVPAVENEARKQLRLVKEGETLVLLDFGEGAGAPMQN